MFLNKINIKSCLLTLFICLPLLSYSTEANSVVRAAVDIGSGATKLKVALINLETQKIEKVLVDESFPVQYQEELEKSKDGKFNESVMATGLDALKKSKEIALKHGASKVVAVATASFRHATNVEAFIKQINDETGIKIHVIDQHLEGVLGFEATAAQTTAHPKNVIVWDIGGGSFQFTTLNENGEIIVHRGVDASIPFKNHIIKHIKNEDPNLVATPNPLNRTQLRDAGIFARQVSTKVDAVFRDKIKDPNTKIIGIGNIFAYGIYPLVGKKNTFAMTDLHEKVQQLEGKSDQDVGGGPYANVGISNPILVLGFMQTLEIHQMDILNINNADGALIYSKFWEN
jgi:exopolyphosphatase / guanosine-5'-triphosphate,3'-diphosphate pyrophosphatase